MAGTRIGVARNIKRALIGKVLGEGGGSSATLARAIHWALEEGAHVISMSLGIDFPGYVDWLVNTRNMQVAPATSLALEEYRANVNLFTELARFVAAYEVIPDQEELIVTTLEQWSDALHLDLIVTTGGTGVAPTDRTPEATRRVIATEVPGLAEAMRQASLKKTVQAVWSRGIAGIRGTCLIVNLPGSRKAARENLEAVLPALAHGIDKLQGGQADCGQPD